jgi:hypothetical protein
MGSEFVGHIYFFLLEIATNQKRVITGFPNSLQILGHVSLIHFAIVACRSDTNVVIFMLVVSRNFIAFW